MSILTMSKYLDDYKGQEQPNRDTYWTDQDNWAVMNLSLPKCQYRLEKWAAADYLQASDWAEEHNLISLAIHFREVAKEL